MTAMLFESNRDRFFPTLDFHHAFQPIYNLKDDCVYGFESLIRSTEVPNPERLFMLAKQQNRLFELDVSSIVKSINTFDRHVMNSQDTKLSVNVYPSTLLESAFHRQLEDVMNKVSLKPEQITFELNEAESVVSLGKLMEATQYLKANGFKIALDDLGKGQSSLRIALELEPDIIKLDRYFCIDLAESAKKQKFLDWISFYFISEGVEVTLEGIETEAEMMIAKQAGIQYGQGYYLGRPIPQLQFTFMK